MSRQYWSLVVSRHVTLCHSMSCHVMLRPLRHVMSCHVTSCHAMSRYVIACHVTSCHAISRYVTSCYVIACHVTLRHVTSRYVTLRHVILDGCCFRASFESSQYWSLVVMFCRVHKTDLSTACLIDSAKADKWLLFVCFAQMYQFPKHQVG